MNYSNARTAQDSYHRFRAKLRGDKNYGNRAGRQREKRASKMRLYVREEEEDGRATRSAEPREADAGFGQRGGFFPWGGGGVFAPGSSGEGGQGGLVPGTSGLRLTGEKVAMDWEMEDDEEEEEQEGKGKGKGKQKSVVVKNEPDEWTWEGPDVTWTTVTARADYS